MRTGVIISGAAHGALIALVVIGLPWFSPREREAIQATEVSFVTEAEFAAAQAAAPAEAPRAEDAPAEVPAGAEPPEAEPEPPPPELAEPEIADPAPELATGAPLGVPAPEAPVTAPSVAVPGPLAAVAPPRSRPTPRVAPDPTPAPPEAARPAEAPLPETAPAPEPEVVAPEQPPVAPPEAAPEPEVAEPTPPAALALTTSGRPKPRRGNVAPDAEASDVLAAVQREIKAEQARLRAEREPVRTAAATPPTPATTPGVTEPTAAAATSLPVGPPLTSGEKDGLKLAVQRCWNVPAGLRDASALRVVVGAELAVDGQVINASIRLVEPHPVPDGAFQQAYEAGRRALLRCSPYSELPREKYAQWRNIEVVFNPEGMVSW